MKYLLPFLILALVSCNSHEQMINSSANLNLNSEWQPPGELAKKDLALYVAAHPEFKVKATNSDWEKLRWVSKAHRILKGGRSLPPSTPPGQWLKKSKDEIVDEFLQDPEFAESVFKFNLYYLGFYKEKIRTPEGWDYQVLENSAALVSAQEVGRGGDYFKLFDMTPPEIVRELYPSSIISPVDGTATDPHEEIYLEMITGLDEKIQWIKQQNPFSMQAFCEKYRDRLYLYGPYRFGFQANFVFMQTFTNDLDFMCPYEPDDDSDDSDDDDAEAVPDRDPDEVLEILAEYKEKLDRLMVFIRKYNDYKMPDQLVDLATYDYSQIEPDYQSRFFNFFQALALPNSSTNYNRKRAAYMLDRFLCDNLLPINVEVPAHHTGGSHGSEPACYSCHYRLDPMAGFFKDIGVIFIDFSQEDQIQFDDGARMDKAQYQSAWKAESGSGRKWNIGVVRSVNDESKNFYGENLNDLFGILKSMPEAHECLTRRMFEYVNSPNQSVDQEYLHEATEEFTQKSKVNSGEAVKSLFKKFVLSNTFAETDPIATECYDLPNGYTAADKPPCAVRYILEKSGHCAECHNNFVNEAGLDLTIWQEIETGVFGFPHEWKGKKYSPQETFTMMRDALSATDVKKRMPKDRHMEPTDREKLYLWLESMLTATGGN